LGIEEREKLLDRYIGIMLAGGKRKDPPVADPEVERQSLAFEIKKWKQEVETERQGIELEKQKA